MAGDATSQLFEGSTHEVAHRLVGCTLWRRLDGERISGRIVETEAYLTDDEASHAFRGQTPRNASMFGLPGTIYVYRIHQSFCLNVVTAAEGVGEAVLIRALDPLDGLDRMRGLRGTSRLGALTSGPGKLCQALGIDLSLDGAVLGGGVIGIDRGVDPPSCVVSTPRIGISRNADAPLRFVDASSAHLSRPLPR